MVSMLQDVVDMGTGAAAARARRALPCRRQDRHHGRFQRRLVRRIQLGHRRRSVGGARPAGIHRSGRVRRALRAADLGRFHGASGARPGRRSHFNRLRPSNADRAVPCEPSAAHRALPEIRRVFQGGGHRAGAAYATSTGRRRERSRKCWVEFSPASGASSDPFSKGTDRLPLVSLDHVSIAYGHLPLLDDASLKMDAGERVCIIGRNGTGKSTLLQILSGDVPPDAGAIWRQPGIGIARLVQDVPLVANRPVFDVVAEGLGTLGDLVADFIMPPTKWPPPPATAPTLRARSPGWAPCSTSSTNATAGRLEQRVELVLDHLELPSDAIVDTLSGGWRRRVLLARALVAQPDLLLLDEPTNHLDIESMTWLETFLQDYAGAVVFVTHDRVFLQNVATRIVELDRGMLTSWPGDYATFLRKKEEWLANEARCQRQVRQTAGKGGGLAAAGRQSAPDARRRARPLAAGHAKRAVGATGTGGRRPPSSGRRGTARASSCLKPRGWQNRSARSRWSRISRSASSEGTASA